MTNEINELIETVRDMHKVLCDHDGNVCVRGSEEDRNVVQASLKALDQLQAHLTPRPIADAPKDGTAILAYEKAPEGVEDDWLIVFWYDDIDETGWAEDNGYVLHEFNPTHFLPLSALTKPEGE